MRLFYTTRWRRLLITTPQFLNARKRVLGTYPHKAILVQPYYRTSLEVILFLPMCSVRRSPSFQRLATEHHQHHYIHVGNFASWKSAVRLTNMTAWARIRSLGDEKPAIICTPRPKDVEGTPARTIASRATCDQNTTSARVTLLGVFVCVRRCCCG